MQLRVKCGYIFVGPSYAARYSSWFCRLYSVLFLHLILQARWVSKKITFLVPDNQQQRQHARGVSHRMTHSGPDNVCKTSMKDF